MRVSAVILRVHIPLFVLRFLRYSMEHSSLQFVSLQEMGASLLAHSSVLITTHVKPDGDAIGSSIGLATFLRAQGVSARIVLASPCPDNLTFLDTEHELEVFDETYHAEIVSTADCFVLLDANDTKRTEHIGEHLRAFPRKKYVIDHHLDPKPFASAYLVDTLACSTCHLVADMIELTGKPMGFATAQALYTGILTDTGNFRFDRTTPDVHRLVARLLEHGVHPLSVYQALYQQQSLAGMRLMGLALAGLSLYHDEKMCVIGVRSAMFHTSNSTEQDTEGLSACLLDIRGVVLGVLITEIIADEKTMIKLSIRSRGNISAQAIAMQFGGGGHFNAAGGRSMTQSYEQVLERVVALGKQALTEYRTDGAEQK